jgi:hypothetical protein
MALILPAAGVQTAEDGWSDGGGPRAQFGETKPTVTLTVDDEHVVKEFILSDRNVPRVTENVDLAIRAQVPPSIALRPFPDVVTAKVPKLKAHQFFVHENRVVVVDPTRKIAEIID